KSTMELLKFAMGDLNLSARLRPRAQGRKNYRRLGWHRQNPQRSHFRSYPVSFARSAVVDVISHNAEKHRVSFSPVLTGKKFLNVQAPAASCFDFEGARFRSVPQGRASTALMFVTPCRSVDLELR